jgi:chemotaxis regulatin CheY-phosphate phosphatase CheZ
MIRLIIPILLLILGWAVLLILARRNERKVRSDWEDLLKGEKADWYEDTKSGIENNTKLIRMTMNEARDIKQLGDIEEALRFLRIGGDVIQEFTPGLLCLLREMMKFSRMVSAMAPVSPLLPSQFHIAEMNNLAVLNQMLHQIAVSAKQRFRLKLRIIATGVKITSGYLLTRIHRVLERRSTSEHEWVEIVNAGQDFQQLTTESVESFRNLIGSLPSGLANQLAENLRMRPSTPSLPTTSGGPA